MKEDSKVVNNKSNKKNYIKGLLIRIIICCCLFLILYFMDMAKVEIFEYNTQKIISMVGDNSIVTHIEKVISNLVK